MREKETQRREERTMTGSGTPREKHASHGIVVSRESGRKSPKTANFSAKANVGRCPRCGKMISRNPETVAYCDCYKYHSCKEPLLLLHHLKKETVAMLCDTFGFGPRTVGLCPVCINPFEFPATKGISTVLPVEVILTSVPRKVSQGRSP